MPQLDVDLFEDFLFFAFLALLVGFGDEEGEEGVINMGTEAFLARFFLNTSKELASRRQTIAHLISVPFQNVR